MIQPLYDLKRGSVQGASYEHLYLSGVLGKENPQNEYILEETPLDWLTSYSLRSPTAALFIMERLRNYIQENVNEKTCDNVEHFSIVIRGGTDRLGH